MIRYTLAVLLLLPVFAQAQALRLRDINNGPAGSEITQMERFGPWVYFGACEEAMCSLWRTDGTRGQIRRERDGVQVGELAVGGEWLYVIDERAAGSILLRTQGASVQAVSNASGPVQPTVLGTLLESSGKPNVFLFGSRNANGVEPWLTDPLGFTLPIANVNPVGDSFPDGFVSTGTHVVFWAQNGTSGRELWTTNGASTTRLADLNPGAASSFVVEDHALLGDWLYLVADDGSQGDELWRTNGSTLELVADIHVGASGSSPRSLLTVAGHMYFVADDGIEGREIWRTDGTTTERVSDLASGAESASFAGLTSLGDWVYAIADAGTGIGRELYRTDGTTVELVEDLWEGPGSGFPETLEAVVLDETLYFAAQTPEAGLELFQVENGGEVFLAADVQPGPGSSSPQHLTALDPYLVFVADDGERGMEPFSYTPQVPVAATPAPDPDAPLVLRVAPNPMRGSGTALFETASATDAEVTLLDALGREVAVLHTGPLAAGDHHMSLPASLTPGVYVLRAVIGAERRTAVVTVVR